MINSGKKPIDVIYLNDMAITDQVGKVCEDTKRISIFTSIVFILVVCFLCIGGPGGLIAAIICYIFGQWTLLCCWNFLNYSTSFYIKR